MEKEELKEISGGTYYVEGNSTIKKGSGKIFDFYIKELCFYSRLGNDIAFEMTLENEEKKISEMFPISYLYDPESWYDHGFKYEDFQRNCTTKEFESSMIEIINLIIKHEKYKAEEVFMGWNLKKVISEEKLRKRTLYLFGKFRKPEKLIKLKEYKNKPKNYVFEYVKFADISIAGPLMSYMLLSLFTSLRFMGVDARPDFNVALVGGDPETRRKTALFFTNLYKRDPHFYKTDYKFFHIMQDDSASDIRFKSAMVRDCVLIAFEPDKRHMKTLLGEVYKTNTIYKKRPIENLLLFTCEKLEKTTPGNTLIIKLDDSHDMSLVKQHFGVDVIRSNEGFLEDDPFGREISRQYELFKNIEKICETKDSRCQIDVKTQKNKETEDE